MHSTACASVRNWSAWGQLCAKHRSCLALEHVRKLIYVRCATASSSLRMTWKLACSSLRRRMKSRHDRGGAVTTGGGGREDRSLSELYSSHSSLLDNR
eukprot:1160816-Pelagomonas_calceolata.AAC.6